MLRLSCGEYEQMEFNNVRRSIYTTTNLLDSQLKQLRSKHAFYLAGLKKLLLEEEKKKKKKEM